MLAVQVLKGEGVIIMLWKEHKYKKVSSFLILDIIMQLILYPVWRKTKQSKFTHYVKFFFADLVNEVAQIIN